MSLWNTTAAGIVNNTIKQQLSCAMEMRYFYLLDQEVQKQFKFGYQPGQENLGDYPTKHHTGPIHQHVRPYYLQMKNSSRLLPRASKPSSRRGCAETLEDPYLRQILLPRIPNSRDFTRLHRNLNKYPKDALTVKPLRTNQLSEQAQHAFGVSAKHITRTALMLQCYTHILLQ